MKEPSKYEAISKENPEIRVDVGTLKVSIEFMDTMNSICFSTTKVQAKN